MNAIPEVGRPAPLGATVVDGGANFSIYSRDTSGVELLLFDDVNDGRPSRVVHMDAPEHRTYHYWHAFVPGLRAGQLYGYHLSGPSDPWRGFRFDAEKLLLDPYGRGVMVPAAFDREAAMRPGDNAAAAMKNVLVDPSAYDWESDAHPRRRSPQTIIYEAHVRGFTRHPNSGVPEATRGTYAGLIEKIPYLKDLGVTAIELLPVFQFDPQAVPPGLVNYWGYQPVSFFAPHQAYSARQDALGPLDEFRDMVKALHRAGLEVILDVVYNHTAEGKADGPTYCFRGIDNRAYYILDGDDRSHYADYSGCGNTFNANHPVVRRMIVDSLRYWVQEMHVDGFRFDLASILSRGPSGKVLPNPPVLWDIESDPVLAGTKLIAEAWDAAGLYQVGNFAGDAWQEWNGRFRDDARQFFRGDNGALRRFADRLVGSPEIYRHKNREAEQSINFVTCHDGFSLNDLVSYNDKHNEANGEENRDGANDNFSWNCGVEGPSDEAAIESLRNRQVKNLLATTMLSIGVPMILMGDEVRRTQNGNNNLYCHDDESTWFDWSLVDRHADVLRFTRLLAAQRSQRTTEHERRQLTLTQAIAYAQQSWHGTKLGQPDWADWSHSLAMSVELRQLKLRVHLIFNAYEGALDFELPPLDGAPDKTWRRWIDTSLESPNDITCMCEAAPISGSAYRVGSRAVAVLIADSERALS